MTSELSLWEIYRINSVDYSMQHLVSLFWFNRHLSLCDLTTGWIPVFCSSDFYCRSFFIDFSSCCWGHWRVLVRKTLINWFFFPVWTGFVKPSNLTLGHGLFLKRWCHHSSRLKNGIDWSIIYLRALCFCCTQPPTPHPPPFHSLFLPVCLHPPPPPLPPRTHTHVCVSPRRLLSDLHVEGLFRVPGHSLRQAALREMLNSGTDIDLEAGGFHPNDAATLLKSYLGELPEPLLTHRHYHVHLKIGGTDVDFSPQDDWGGSNPSPFRRDPFLRVDLLRRSGQQDRRPRQGAADRGVPAAVHAAAAGQPQPIEAAARLALPHCSQPAGQQDVCHQSRHHVCTAHHLAEERKVVGVLVFLWPFCTAVRWTSTQTRCVVHLFCRCWQATCRETSRSSIMASLFSSGTRRNFSR